MLWPSALCAVLQLQTPNPQAPRFTSGNPQVTTQPPAPATQFTTGTVPASTPPGSFTTGASTVRTPAPGFTSGASPSTAGTPSFTSGQSPGNTAAPTFTSGPVPLTTGAFALPIRRMPVISDGVVVVGVFIPHQRAPDTGPPREAYLPTLEERLRVLDGRVEALRTRAFEHSGPDRDTLRQTVAGEGARIDQARHARASLANVVEENFPEARDQMDALLLDVTRRLDAVDAALAR